MLMDFVYFLLSSDLAAEEDAIVEQSRQAYLAQRREKEREHAEVTTDSESDNPEDWLQLRQSQTMNRDMQGEVKEQRLVFKRYRRRLIAKEVDKRFLHRRRIPKRVSKTPIPKIERILKIMPVKIALGQILGGELEFVVSQEIQGEGRKSQTIGSCHTWRTNMILDLAMVKLCSCVVLKIEEGSLLGGILELQR